MKLRNKMQRFLMGMTLLVVSQNLFAQKYNKEVEQYCYLIGNHPSQCVRDGGFNGSVYFGLMMSSMSGDAVVEHSNLGGIDIGVRLTNTWGHSCRPVSFDLNAYFDLKLATYMSFSDEDEEDQMYPTNYAAQLAITPGVRFSLWSFDWRFDCGPYIGYYGFKNDYKRYFSDPDASGLDYGLRFGTAVLLEVVDIEIGLHYDMGLTDHKGDFKKKDLVLSVGYKF